MLRKHHWLSVLQQSPQTKSLRQNFYGSSSSVSLHNPVAPRFSLRVVLVAKQFLRQNNLLSRKQVVQHCMNSKLLCQCSDLSCRAKVACRHCQQLWKQSNCQSLLSQTIFRLTERGSKIFVVHLSVQVTPKYKDVWIGLHTTVTALRSAGHLEKRPAQNCSGLKILKLKTYSIAYPCSVSRICSW